MTHVRKTIRDEAVTLLSTITGVKRVYNHRFVPIDDRNLPALAVYLEEEAVQPESSGKPTPLARTASLKIQAYASARTDLEDVLDGIIESVETVFPDESVLTGVRSLRLARVATFTDATGATPIGGAEITYLVRYRTEQGTPSQAI